MQLRYRYRLYPTPGQRVALARAFGCARVVFNDGLRARQAAHAAGLPYIGDTDLQKQVITRAKLTPERAWLGEVSSVVLVQALADLHVAYRNFFASLAGERKGPEIAAPRFRSRKDVRQSVRLTRNGFRVRPGGRLRVAKVGEIKVRWSRPLPSEPSSVTVVRDAAGRYFASFVVEVEDEPLPAGGREVGVDLGLADFAVLSDGTKISNPRWLRSRERKLKRAQQALSRTQKGSRNRGKAARRVAKAHARAADARREFHHQLSSWLVRDNQAVYVETLSVKGLARTRQARGVHDAGWAAFVRMLEYKAARHGRTVAKVARDFPSTQLCSQCGRRDGPKPLRVRAWACPGCGARHDRDHNAARNVLHEGRRLTSSTVAAGCTPAQGHAETPNACGEPVRPPFAVARFVEPGTRQKPEAA
ncbi:RNA-guided endonuclease InsQ/TnpB family protein [Actinomadura hibisca]|uniref:RNA-guided endonuclease InsQ/TnpB family protein n=1 Tax=Actinomadura hibisca TaxID=68565 RepID=UPI000833D3EF|nr:RNA-guided endonuclease TnpB family protein [Actinomadura hibisca]